MKKRTRNIWLLVILAFVLMQFFPIEKTNPPSDPANDFITIENPPQQVGTLLKNACYDCHSYHTKYPWYANIQPVGWWIRSHYRGARQNLNYSEWRQYNEEDKPHGLEEMAEEVEEKTMPLKSYTWMHPDAKLSEKDRQVLVEYFKGKSR